MRYRIIGVPYPEMLRSLEPDRCFRAMTDEQSRCYYEWFLGQMPERIEELEHLVRSTPGFGAWRADKTPTSLNTLGQWFAATVKKRPLSQEERDAILRSLDPSRPYSVQDWTLTTESLSLCFDVAMYLSAVMLRNLAGVHWGRVTKPKRDADLNQPVLLGFGVPTAVPMPAFPLNSLRVVRVLAYGLAEEKKVGSGLRQVYDTWAVYVDPQSWQLLS